MNQVPTYFKYLVFIFSLLIAGLSVASPNKITIGMLPSGNLESIKSQALNLAQNLQDKVKIPVEIYISKNYSGLIEAIKSKKVDFAFFSAMTFVQTEKDTALKVLLKKTWDGPYYYSAFVTLKDSKLKKVSDLKNKKIAFVDENSTSGYLYPQVHLQKNKIKSTDFKEILFSGSHAQSIDWLETGKVNAVAVFADDEKGIQGAWTRFAKNKESKFKTLWISAPIPNDPIVVRAEFYNDNPKLTHEIMYSLIQMQNEPATRPLVSEVLGHGDLMPATSGQYGPVREMVQLLKSGVK